MKCPKCKMGYVPEVTEDFIEHKKYHDKVVNGLRTRPLKSDKTIWTMEDARITVVNQSSPSAQRRGAGEVAKLAHRDSNFDFPSYNAGQCLDERNVHVFIFHKRNHAIGLLVIEKLDHIWKATWPDWDLGREPKEILRYSLMWSICMVWVLKRRRRSGFAKTMIKKAVTYLGCNMESIGWYTPFTDSGEALARSCCPKHFYICKLVPQVGLRFT